MRKLSWIAVAAIAWATTGWVGSVEAAGLVIDSKDVELSEVLRLLAAQGGPTLVADPAVAKDKVTFAVKGVQPDAAVRWLCRACRLAVVSGEGGRLTIGPPLLDKAILKEYSLASVAATPAAEDMSLRVVAADLGKQLRAEPVWFDGAYVFARSQRRGLWDDFSVRVYNLSGRRGGPDTFALEAAERRALDRGRPPGPWPPGPPGERGGDRSADTLPYAVIRVGDLALAALPQERHKDVEDSQKGGGPPPGPPGPPPPPFRK